MIGAGKDLGVDATVGMSVGPAGYPQGLVDLQGCYPQGAELAWPQDGAMSHADGRVLYA
jgi:hypothetical protein